MDNRLARKSQPYFFSFSGVGIICEYHHIWKVLYVNSIYFMYMGILLACMSARGTHEGHNKMSHLTRVEELQLLVTRHVGARIQTRLI